jgi:hypothetical protein
VLAREKREALKGFLIMLHRAAKGMAHVKAIWECSRLRSLICVKLKVLYNTLGGENGRYT